MDTTERARAIRAEFNRAELALAEIDSLATADFRAALDTGKLAKAEAALARAAKAVHAAHKAALACVRGSDDLGIRSGGGGGK